jgi:hypothetical protein
MSPEIYEFVVTQLKKAQRKIETLELKKLVNDEP